MRPRLSDEQSIDGDLVAIVSFSSFDDVIERSVPCFNEAWRQRLNRNGSNRKVPHTTFVSK